MEKDVINAMSCLCSWRKKAVVKVLSAQIMCDSKAVKVPPAQLEKEYCVPSEVEANCC